MLVAKYENMNYQRPIWTGFSDGIQCVPSKTFGYLNTLKIWKLQRIVGGCTAGDILSYQSL